MRAQLVVRALLLVLVACSSDAKRDAKPVAPPGTAPVVGVAEIIAPAPATDIVVVIASGMASRTSVSPRIARRIVAARRGAVEISRTHTSVSLMVSEVVSGTLFDPDYAKRPVGTNHLPIILVDEAAFIAPTVGDAFEGTWRLTRLADDTLVASAIEDTPWPASTVAARRTQIVQARKDLRSPLPEQRLAGLDALADHMYLELVPDVIALLEDNRSHGVPVAPPGNRRSGPRIVGNVAELTLRTLVAPLADPATPATASPDEWATFWRTRTTQIEAPTPIVATAVTEHIRLPTYQSWPEFARTSNGIVVGVSRLETPLDGNAAGVFVIANGKRSWLSRIVPEAIEAVGAGVLYAESGSSWLFKVIGGKKPRAGSITGANARAVYNTLAPAEHGFLVLGVDQTKTLLAQLLDDNGKPLRSRQFVLDAFPESSYARSVHPLAVARRPGGWLAVVATRTGVLAANIEEPLQLVGTTPLSPRTGIIQPKLAVGTERAFAIWASDHRSLVLEHIVLDLTGKPISAVMHGSSEVSLVAAPVALDDGFAAAWIEAHDELHVGRWNRDGERVANVVVQRHHVGPFALQLQREGAALVVTYLDQTRYPFPLVSRRLEIANLR